jgi:hypothetical protein
MFTTISTVAALGATLVAAQSGTFPAGVAGTGTMGVTNPTQVRTECSVPCLLI